jgi:hypothetical protein
MKNFRSLRVMGVAQLLAVACVFSMVSLPAASAKGLVAVPARVTQAKQDFELHNETGLEITNVYLSETGKTNWEEDVLGQDTLESGDSVNISFGGQKANIWDMKVVFSNGKEDFWLKLNLSQLTDITISFKNGKTWATTKNGD